MTLDDPTRDTNSSPPPDQALPRSIDRMVLFSDAVVAIAITLLILPLVEIASDHDLTVASLFRDYGGQLVACGVSFAVIAQYWVSHHDLFSRIDRQTPSIMWLNLLWLATIVFLPLPTEMLANDPHGDRAVHAFYIGSVLAASLAFTLTALLVQRVGRADGREISVSFVTPALIAAALAIAVGVPAVGMWAMLLMALSRPLNHRLARSRHAA